MKNNKLNRPIESICRFTKTVKITEAMNSWIKAKSMENHCSESEIIKQAIWEYMNKNMSDNEIFHQSLQEIKQKLYTLENKIKKYPIVMYQLARDMKQVLPSEQIYSEQQVDLMMEDFNKNVASMSAHYRDGYFETIIIDEREKYTRDDK